MKSVGRLSFGLGLALARGSTGACPSQADVAETEGAAFSQGEGVPPLGDRMDRVGRPEITNVTLRPVLTKKAVADLPLSLKLRTAADATARAVAAGNGPSQVKEAVEAAIVALDQVKQPILKFLNGYNEEDSFSVRPEKRSEYVSFLDNAMEFYDSSFDGSLDMSKELRGKFATMLLDDQLRIDLSRPCLGVNNQGYWAMERADLTGGAYDNCGGRSPNEDSVDKLLTFYANGPLKKALVLVSDGVDQPVASKATDTFPYLAKPYALP